MFHLRDSARLSAQKSFQNPLPSGAAPNFVLEDFLDAAIARRCRDEITAAAYTDFVRYSNPFFELDKFTLNQMEKMPATVRTVFEELHSPAFVSKIEELTGIRSLKVDPAHWGGGIHVTRPGGYLAVHKDFNVLPSSYAAPKQLRRVINIIGYFNERWREEDGGMLEIWDREGNGCLQKIAPLFNHWAIFDTRGTYHGHPYPLRGRNPRMSIATYYYVEESVPRDQWHSTEYLKLPWMPESEEYRKARAERADPKLRYATLLPGETKKAA